jgi:hypothetical protein
MISRCVPRAPWPTKNIVGRLPDGLALGSELRPPPPAALIHFTATALRVSVPQDPVAYFHGIWTGLT